ncbi:pre-mRNA-splicing factor CWC22 homolog [Diachasma alloeum]|uniref:pre-mRNA-splicing factor CWC22 homolog n=1 Tax=Diachasma alloeum TaxID=454923 RepID=UPI00073829DE|nr:pre-mRNA-splicing factor CWC22 homolog [Diachasma alloeum]
MDRPDFEDNQGRCAPGRLKRLQSFQVLLLRHALLNFPKVKRVIYSTCSMYPEENEMVVDEVLGDIGQAYKLVSIKELLKDQWINFSSKDYQCGENCLYARPDVDQSNGFFIAVFERHPEVPLPEHHKKNKVNRRSTSNNGEETVFEDETDNTWRDKKCKKKRKSKRDEDVDEDDHVRANNIDGGLKKVKISEDEKIENHRSRRKFTDDEIDKEKPLSEDISGKKRKRKHKKDIVRDGMNIRDAENNLNNNVETVEEIGEFETAKKKKKKKRKHEESQVDRMNENQTDEKSIEIIWNNYSGRDEGQEAVKKSKKKKKKQGRKEKHQ